MYGWILVISFYLLPFLLVEVFTKKSVTNRLSAKTISYIVLCALPVGFAVGLATVWPAVFCCNCFSFKTFGNNHFDEDVMLSHSLSTAAWVSAWTHQLLWKKTREGNPSFLGPHVILVSLFTLFMWSTVTWIPPGCDH